MIKTCLILMSILGTPPDREACKLIEDNSVIDSEIMFIVAGIESAYNEKAESSAGAVGFVQITPIALKEVKRNIRLLLASDLQGDAINHFLLNCIPVLFYTEGDMYMGEKNVRTGGCFMHLLLSKYEQDIWKALAHYNCGGVCVRQLEAYKPLNRETSNYLIKYEMLRRRLNNG